MKVENFLPQSKIKNDVYMCSTFNSGVTRRNNMDDTICMYTNRRITQGCIKV